MAKITLTRSRAYTDKLRSYQIILDGKIVGKIRDGHVWTFDCPIGKHTMELKVDWGYSPPLEFELASENDVVELECGSNMKGLKLLFAIAFLFKPRQWIALSRVS